MNIAQGNHFLSTYIDTNKYINDIIIEFESIQVSDSHLSNIAERSRLQKREKATEFEKIAFCLRYFQQRCPYCFVNGLTDDNHLLQKCRQAGAETFKDIFRHYGYQLRYLKKFPFFLACSYCYTPVSLCQRWKYDEKQFKWVQGKGKCTYEDVIVSVFVIGLHFEEDTSSFNMRYRQRLEERKISMDREIGEISYLSEGYTWGENESIRLLTEFLEAADEILRIRYINIHRTDLSTL